MTCNNCSRNIDTDSNYCKYCGAVLRESLLNSDPSANLHQTIFGNAYVAPARSNADLGYLIIAMMIILNALTWVAWRYLSSAMINGNENTFKLVRLVSVFISIAQFVVMFIFTKRQSYKIIIAVIAAFVIIYDVYFLIEALSL